MLRWTDEQSKQIYTANVALAHVGFFAPQSKHTLLSLCEFLKLLNISATCSLGGPVAAILVVLVTRRGAPKFPSDSIQLPRALPQGPSRFPWVHLEHDPFFRRSAFVRLSLEQRSHMPLRSTHSAASGVMGSSRSASEATTQSMGFASAASMPAAHPGYASAAMSNAPGFDLADFPALGSQVPPSSSANSSNTSGMFSTYASHAGTGVSNSPMMMSRGGAPFSQEEFPTLHRAHAVAAVAAQDSRNNHAGMSYGPEQGAPTWQQDPQPRASLAQDLRKQGLHAPSQATQNAASVVTTGGPNAAQSQGMWMQSYGSQPQFNRINLARLPHDSATGTDNSQAAVLNAFNSSHDAMQRTTASASAYGTESTHLPIQQVLTSPVDRFGLVGLVSLMKTQNPDVALLTMGSNLQALGMNLDASDALSASFVTPWSQDPAAASKQVEPAYQLPACYNVQPPLAQTKVASFSDETLFFIFYSTPRDALQEVAAAELYARNWRYHKGLHLWLTKDPNMEPLQKTPTYERGTYVFFDPGSWEKVSKNFVLMYEMLEEKQSSQSILAAASVHGTTTARSASTPTPTTVAVAAAHAAAAPHGTQPIAPTHGSSMPSSNQASPQPSYS